MVELSPRYLRMAEVRSKKGTGPSNIEDGFLPITTPAELRKQIMSEKDEAKKSELVANAWENYGQNPEGGEFISQSKKKNTKPKPTGAVPTSNGDHATPKASNPAGRGRGNGGTRPSRGGGAAGGLAGTKRTDFKQNSKATSSSSTGPAETSTLSAPSTVIPSSSAKPVTESATPAAVSVSTGTSSDSTKTKASGTPVQSVWAASKPLSKKLSEKPEEEKRLAEERAKLVLQKQQEEFNRIEEERRKKLLAQQEAAAAAAAAGTSSRSASVHVEQSAPAPAVVNVEEKKTQPRPYLSAATRGNEKKKPSTSTPSTQIPGESAPKEVASVSTEGSSAAQIAFEPVTVAPEPVSTLAAAPVRVPEGFGASSHNFTFGDFVESSATSTKLTSAPWGVESESASKKSEAANGAFLSTLMAGGSAAASSVSSIVASAASVKEVESQMLSSVGAGTNAPEAVAPELVIPTPPVLQAAPVPPQPTPSVQVQATQPQPTAPSNPAPNPLMMVNPSMGYRPLQVSSNQVGGAGNVQQQNTGMPKKGGRGGQGAVQGGRGGSVLGGMRMPYNPMDAYYYQQEHSQGGFGIPYAQPTTYAADPMYQAQYGYGASEMGFYAQQSQAAHAPPGLGGVSSSSQGPSANAGEFAAGNTSQAGSGSDIAATQSAPAPGGVGLGTSSQPQYQLQQQGAYLNQPYTTASYGQVNQANYMQQQANQQQHAGNAGNAAGATTQHQDAAGSGGYPATTPFAGAANFPPPNMYPYYGSQMFYPAAGYQYNRGYGGFPAAPVYGQPLPQADQARQSAGNAPYYQNQNAAPSSGDAAGGSSRPAPPGYAPSFAQQQQQPQQQQQQQQQHAGNEPNWISQQQQQENYGYRQPNYYPNVSSGQDWRRQ